MNTITVTGNLTADPELYELPNSDQQVCELRLAVEGMGRGNEVGYIDVACYGNSGAAAAKVLTKGWKVAVTGRLEWRSWQSDRTTRQAHRVIGNVEFLTAPKGAKAQSEAADRDAEPIAF